ncbi:MAG: hypothetical protein AB1576_08880 [Bacillota bacterium]
MLQYNPHCFQAQEENPVDSPGAKASLPQGQDLGETMEPQGGLKG